MDILAHALYGATLPGNPARIVGLDHLLAKNIAAWIR